MANEWVHIECAGETFRTRKERTFLAQSLIEKTLVRDKAIGNHEIVKFDCEILDRETKIFRELVDADFKGNITDEIVKSTLIPKLLELREKKLETQQTVQSGELKTL